MRSIHAGPLSILFPSARVSDGITAPQVARPWDSRKSFEIGSLVARLSNASRRVAIPNKRHPRSGSTHAGATHTIYVQATTRASADSSNSRASAAGLIRGAHPLAAVRRGCQQLEAVQNGCGGRRIHPADCALHRGVHALLGKVAADSEEPRSWHVKPQNNTTAPRQASIGSQGHQQRSTCLDYVDRSSEKMASAPQAWGYDSVVEEAHGKYRRLNNVSGEIETVSPVRTGFQNHTGEYVAMLLRYAKVQEAGSPSFRKKRPSPIRIPAKAA